MRYKAKVFKSHLRRMANGKKEFFCTIQKPSAFQMFKLKNRKKK